MYFVYYYLFPNCAFSVFRNTLESYIFILQFEVIGKFHIICSVVCWRILHSVCSQCKFSARNSSWWPCHLDLNIAICTVLTEEWVITDDPLLFMTLTMFCAVRTLTSYRRHLMSNRIPMCNGLNCCFFRNYLVQSEFSSPNKDCWSFFCILGITPISSVLVHTRAGAWMKAPQEWLQLCLCYTMTMCSC